MPRAFKGSPQEGRRRGWAGPWLLAAGAAGPCHAHSRLAEHLVPIEDRLPLLLNLQLPALLGALHSLQDSVGTRSPQRGGGGGRRASILSGHRKETRSTGSRGVSEAQGRSQSWNFPGAGSQTVSRASPCHPRAAVQGVGSAPPWGLGKGGSRAARPGPSLQRS